MVSPLFPPTNFDSDARPHIAIPVPSYLVLTGDCSPTDSAAQKAPRAGDLPSPPRRGGNRLRPHGSAGEQERGGDRRVAEAVVGDGVKAWSCWSVGDAGTRLGMEWRFHFDTEQREGVPE